MKSNEQFLTVNQVKKLTDFLLLNAYSMESSGLYWGKSGLSLVLFELARHYKNENWVDHAFDLMQQALLTRQRNIGLEEGLTGIGLLLLHCQLYHDYVDMDFDELFSDKREFINCELEKEINNKNSILHQIGILDYFIYLSAFWSKKEETLCQSFIEKLLQEFQLVFNNSNRIKDNWEVVRYSKKMGQLLSRLSRISQSLYDTSTCCDLLSHYVRRYNEGIIVANLETCFYLGQSTCKRFNNDSFNTEKVICSVIQNIFSEGLALQEKITLLYLLKQYDGDNGLLIDRIERSIIGNGDKELEVNLRRHIPMSIPSASFRGGIAHLLFYHIYDAEKELANKDIFHYGLLI